MRNPILLAVVLGICAAVGTWSGSSHAAEQEAPTQLCVVWSSGDPGVAKNVCFMYTLNAKKRGWFDVVHLVVWGPSAKLLTEDEELQKEVKAMQDVGVVVEACVTCANNYGVADELRVLDRFGQNDMSAPSAACGHRTPRRCGNPEIGCRS